MMLNKMKNFDSFVVRSTWSIEIFFYKLNTVIVKILVYFFPKDIILNYSKTRGVTLHYLFMFRYKNINS